MATLRRRLPGNERLRRFGSDFLPSSLSETLGAVVEDPTLRPSQLAVQQGEIEAEQGREVYDPFVLDRPITEEDRPKDLVDPEKLNQEFGHLGLSFDRPESRAAAEIMARNKRAEMIRQDIIARGPQGVGPSVLKFGAAFAGAAIDPLNIAAGLFPVPGAARLAGVSLQAGRAGRAALTVGQRARLGFVEGSVGNLAIEPVVGALATEQQLDYGLSDAFLNVALGGLIGSGVHAVRGVMPSIARRMRPETRNEALRAATVQLAEGRTVDVDPVVRADVDLRSSASFRAATQRPVIRGVDEVVFRQAERDVDALAATDADGVVDLGPSARPMTADEFVQFAEARQRISIANERKRLREVIGGRTPDQELGAPVSLRQSPDEAQARLAELDEMEAELSSGDFQVRAREAATRSGERTVNISDRFTPKELAEATADVADFRSRLSGLVGTERPDVVRKRLDVERRQVERRRQDFARDIVRRETLPERDSAADFGASDHAAQAAEESLSEPDFETATRELEFAERQIEELRAAGALDRASEREIGELQVLTERAEAMGRGIRAAATCLLR